MARLKASEYLAVARAIERLLPPILMARSPIGGIQIAGTFYPGGQFIPGEELEKATPEQKRTINRASIGIEPKPTPVAKPKGIAKTFSDLDSKIADRTRALAKLPIGTTFDLPKRAGMRSGGRWEKVDVGGDGFWKQGSRYEPDSYFWDRFPEIETATRTSSTSPPSEPAEANKQFNPGDNVQYTLVNGRSVSGKVTRVERLSDGTEHYELDSGHKGIPADALTVAEPKRPVKATKSELAKIDKLIRQEATKSDFAYDLMMNQPQRAQRMMDEASARMESLRAQRSEIAKALKMGLDPYTCNAVARILERLIPPIRMSLDRQIRMATWTKYEGPRGGNGWRNSESGEVLYQDEKPGDGGESSDQSTESRVLRKDERTGYNVTKNDTEGATTQLGYAGMREGFNIATPDGARVNGYVAKADFPGKSSEETRAELFYIEIPKESRGKGLGKKLAGDAIRLMVANGAKTVNIDATTKEGEWLIKSLVSSGLISEPINTSKSGKAEFEILSGKPAEPPEPSTPVTKWASKRFKDPAHAKAFVKWFGDSKVVDEQSEPQKNYGTAQPIEVHHGSDFEFDEFDKKRQDWSSESGKGFYFSDNQSVAKKYAGKKVMTVYLAIRNPMDLDNPVESKTIKSIGDAAATMKKGFDLKAYASMASKAKTGHDIYNYIYDNMPADSNRVISAAGFDGITHKAINDMGGRFGGNPGQHGRTWIAFDPSQVKSTNNVGTFDPANPKITMSREAKAWQP